MHDRFGPIRPDLEQRALVGGAAELVGAVNIVTRVKTHAGDRKGAVGRVSEVVQIGVNRRGLRSGKGGERDSGEKGDEFDL